MDASSTGGAQPASSASRQRLAHRHQRWPALRPAKRYAGLGVTKSFPRERENVKNASVRRTHTKWDPWSDISVLQQPSRKYPVTGSNEQASSAVPRTFLEIIVLPEYVHCRGWPSSLAGLHHFHGRRDQCRNLGHVTGDNQGRGRFVGDA